MSVKAVAVVAVGGLLGALARAGVVSAGGMWSVLAVNAVGCLLIGVLAARTAPGTLPRLFVGTGILGGFTTFSAYTVDGLRLAGSGRPLATALYLGGTVAAALAAVWLGGALARRRP